MCPEGKDVLLYDPSYVNKTGHNLTLFKSHSGQGGPK